MSRIKTISITLSLALLAFFCLQAQALSFFDGHPLRSTIMNAYASSSGIVDLSTDSYGVGVFFVEADLTDHPSSSSNRSNSKNETTSATNAEGTVRMMLSISNSETMVAADCFQFSKYDCSQYSSCFQFIAQPTIEYPAFTANTKLARADMYLDYNYWRLSSTAGLYIAQSCKNDGATSLGTYRSGVIGLGTTGYAKDNWNVYPQKFTIRLNSDLMGGKLIFKDESSRYSGLSPAYTLNANSTWQLPIYNGGYLKVRNAAVGFVSGNVMFDINSDVIGLPDNHFRAFVDYMSKYVGTCGASYNTPVCYFAGRLRDLPDITLYTGSHTLTIPPSIYASAISDSASSSSYYLNFKATSPYMTGKSYITPSFQNSVIVGSYFMKYYDIVFDASSSSGSNVIYLYDRAVDPSSNNNWMFFVVGGIFLVLICCCCANNRRKTVNNGVTAVLVNTTTTQAPLIINQQGVSPNGYNYGGYVNNGSQQPQVVYPTYNTGYQQPHGGLYVPADNGYSGGYPPQSQPPS